MTLYLLINGIIFLIVGLRALFTPVDAVAVPYGLIADETDAKSYLRSSAGGVGIVAGAVQLAGSMMPMLALPALVMVVTILSGLILGRLMSLMLDGKPGFFVWFSAGFEMLGLVLGAYWLLAVQS